MKTVILDRDGVINKNPPDMGYVTNLSDFSFIPNSLQAIRDLSQHGYHVFIATNQAGIGKGIFTESQLAIIHDRMQSEIEKVGGKIIKVYYCPHHPESGCDCRKPKPGMLLKAVHDYDLNSSNIYFIGDSITDIEAGRHAGITPILVLSGHGLTSYNRYVKPNSTMKHQPYKIFTNLYTASRWLIR